MNKLQNLIENLKKANQRLKQATKTKPTQMNKDATIQRFEFTFELAWKTMQEYIRDQGFDCKSPKNCIREGARLDLIDNPEKWFEFLNNRNLIAHTYNEKIANMVYRKAIKFSQNLDKFLQNIT
ncbi:nucleotidyltransferase substrate binding protein [Patescibacteria group bacterium]|nr:nucleotidyltransferase substrate binding protein [Patescibacteria group bacterium]MBU1519591.1 nucleotidyltransferase substrate binding protein [Patescibacteria group bacterium]MBU1729988.1 nucleotidyltransferase substrate binding protein [Patescibacteria group bacterium]MBU2416565.1 nucleotidyltransferase substrate binding protein [Patescibacteria group bacterium]MBU2460920.1 nucleotidyltransferase substrate binding protein [Patescibacteria group bacterium]